jgi:hypothetical protein
MSVTLANANFISISQFKKLQFEITGADYGYLKAKFNTHFQDSKESAKSCLHEYDNKYYCDVTLNSWQQSDSSLMKFQDKVDHEKKVNVAVIPEFYDFVNKELCKVRGMSLRYVKGL